METSNRKMKSSAQCIKPMKGQKARQSYMHIPDCLPSDSTNNTVNTLFNEEIELTVDKLVPETSPESVKIPKKPVSCKRKLELEVHSLSDRKSLKISTPKFKDLQKFWENRSGEQEVGAKLRGIQDEGKKFEEEQNSLFETDSKLQSPIDSAVHSYVSNVHKKCSGVKKSQKDLIKDYTEIVAKSTPSPRTEDKSENLAVNEKERSINVGNDCDVTKDDSDCGFNDMDTPRVKLSLKEFRALNREYQERAVISEKHSDNTVEDDSILMPPPAGIQTCLSVSKSFNRMTSTALKDRGRKNIACQRLFSEDEFSPEDLSPIRHQMERKKKTKRRLMSLDPNTYSQFPTPLYNSCKTSTSRLDGTQSSKKKSHLNIQIQNKTDRSTESACMPMDKADCVRVIDNDQGKPDMKAKGDVNAEHTNGKVLLEKNVSYNCESYTRMTHLNDTSVWSEDSRSCEQEQARQEIECTEPPSIANLSPITPLARSHDQVSLTTSLDFSETDLSVYQSLSLNQTDGRCGQVTMAIFNKVDEFMHTSDSSVKGDASCQIIRAKSDRYVGEHNSHNKEASDIFTDSVPVLVEVCDGSLSAGRSGDVTDNLGVIEANSSVDDPVKLDLKVKSPKDQTNASDRQNHMNLEALRKDETKVPSVSTQLKSPKPLASISVESLVKTRSEYSVLKKGQVESLNYLSVPLHIEIPSETLQSSNPCMAQNKGETTLETHDCLPQWLNTMKGQTKDVTDHSSIATSCGGEMKTLNDFHSKTLAEVFDPCWSPDLQLQPLTCSPHRNDLSWSPILRDQEPALHDSDRIQHKFANPMRTGQLEIDVVLVNDAAGAETTFTSSPKLAKVQRHNMFEHTSKEEDKNGGNASRKEVLGTIIVGGSELWEELETASVMTLEKIQVTNSLDPDQAPHSVEPDRNPNCLQRSFTDVGHDLDSNHLQSSPAQVSSIETEDCNFTLMLDISASSEESLSSFVRMDQYVSELLSASEYSSSSSEAYTLPVYTQFTSSATRF